MNYRSAPKNDSIFFNGIDSHFNLSLKCFYFLDDPLECWKIAIVVLVLDYTPKHRKIKCHFLYKKKNEKRRRNNGTE